MNMNELASKLSANGVIGVIPTDTLYGVVCRAGDNEAVGRLYKLKERENKPGTIIAADIKQLEELGLKYRYLKAVEQFWPGAVSVVIPAANPNLSYLHQGKMSLAVRVPADKRLQALLKETGPLLTSSANQPGKEPAATPEQAKKYFGDKVDFYEDGGDLSGRQPSTLIRVLDDAIEVLRQGAVNVDSI